MRLMSYALALAALATPAFAADDKKDAKGDFLTQALGNALSLEKFSALALTKANNSDVKDLAKDINSKAIKCRDKLVAAAKERKTGLVLGLEKDRQATLAALALKTGDDFDRGFLDQVIKDLDDSCKTMKNEKSDKYKSIITDSSKDCKEGLERARKLRAKLGKSTK